MFVYMLFFLHNLRTFNIIWHPNLSTLNVPDEGYFNPDTPRQDNAHQIKIHVIPLVIYQLIIFSDATKEHGKQY